jgi:hypothetical protein
LTDEHSRCIANDHADSCHLLPIRACVQKCAVAQHATTGATLLKLNIEHPVRFPRRMIFIHIFATVATKISPARTSNRCEFQWRSSLSTRDSTHPSVPLRPQLHLSKTFWQQGKHSGWPHGPLTLAALPKQDLRNTITQMRSAQTVSLPLGLQPVRDLADMVQAQSRSLKTVRKRCLMQNVSKTMSCKLRLLFRGFGKPFRNRSEERDLEEALPCLTTSMQTRMNCSRA